MDKQEVKRQALKQRVEAAKVESDSEINWDDEEELGEAQDIPGEEAVKLYLN